MTKPNRPAGIMTRAIHAGDAPDASTNASAPPIHMSSTYVTEDLAGFLKAVKGSLA